MLLASKRIRSLRSFCNDYGLNRTKYSKVRSRKFTQEEVGEEDPKNIYKLIDIDALSYLVEDYGVNPEWLLTGKGGMFKQSN